MPFARYVAGDELAMLLTSLTMTEFPWLMSRCKMRSDSGEAMITLDDTRALMRRAHAGQMDKAGMPYHEHPERVLARLLERWPETLLQDEQHAALLHDVLEDTAVTAPELRKLGYSSHTVKIVQAVTKPKNRPPYLKWIQSLADSEFIAPILIKWSDCCDNADPARLALLPPDMQAAFAEKYGSARAILEVPLEQLRIRQAKAKEAHRYELNRWYADPPVVYRNAGDDDVNGGPITESGWYVDPYCHPMCCRPDGPFSTADEARDWAWREYEIPVEMRVVVEV